MHSTSFLLFLGYLFNVTNGNQDIVPMVKSVSDKSWPDRNTTRLRNGIDCVPDASETSTQPVIQAHVLRLLNLCSARPCCNSFAKYTVPCFHSSKVSTSVTTIKVIMMQFSLILLSFQSLCFQQCAATKRCFSNDSHIGLCLEAFDSGRVQADLSFFFFRQRIRRTDQMDCIV